MQKNSEKKTIDSYVEFINKFCDNSNKTFMEYGISKCIFCEDTKELKEHMNKIWDGKLLKCRFIGNKVAKSSDNYKSWMENNLTYTFYNEVLKLTVSPDGSNNTEVKKMINNCEYVKKEQKILNFTISHIFGRTKNIFAFTAPWNVVYVPHMFDQLTTGKGNGQLVQIFETMLKYECIKKYRHEIKEFNKKMDDIINSENFANWLSTLKNEKEKFNHTYNMLVDFFPIDIIQIEKEYESLKKNEFKSSTNEYSKTETSHKEYIEAFIENSNKIFTNNK